MEANFIINDFEGPLDLLLHLIKTSKMDIYDIKIEEITSQYLDFINRMNELNLDVASEYLVMASELTLIKSKMLLPRHEDEEEEEDPRENLVNRLIEYQRYKEMIDEFKSLERDRKDIFTKDPMNLYEYSDPIKNDGDITLDNLVEALNKFLQRKEDEKPLETKIARKELLVTDIGNPIEVAGLPDSAVLKITTPLSGEIYIAYPADDPWACTRQVIGDFPDDFMNDREQPSWNEVSPREDL